MKINNTVKHLTFSAVFAALIFVSITVTRIPNGLGGFIHFGDSLIYLSAALLPFPYGLLVAAIGPGLFNLFSESPFWFPFTVIIKPITALCFSNRGTHILGNRPKYRNYIAPVIAGTLNTVLYFFANMALFSLGFLGVTSDRTSAWTAGIVSLPGLLMQAGGSIVFFYIIAFALDKMEFKRRVFTDSSRKLRG
ncbi:MAG: TIGR04002 family protein [Oscillospiraceae bacterium]|nr:TIGR04002 family protein [Oscillospiraceae bacterium]